MKRAALIALSLLSFSKLQTGNELSDGYRYMASMNAVYKSLSEECQQYGYNTPECQEPDDDGGK